MNGLFFNVVENTMNLGLGFPPISHAATLFRQTPDLVGFKYRIVRTPLDSLQGAVSVRRELHSFHPNLGFAAVATIDRGFGRAGIGVHDGISFVRATHGRDRGCALALRVREE